MAIEICGVPTLADVGTFRTWREVGPRGVRLADGTNWAIFQLFVTDEDWPPTIWISGQPVPDFGLWDSPNGRTVAIGIPLGDLSDVADGSPSDYEFADLTMEIVEFRP